MSCSHNLTKNTNTECMQEVPAFGRHKSFSVKEECLEDFYIALNQSSGVVENRLKDLTDSGQVVINYM